MVKCNGFQFIDDLHWADASSLGLLFHLARYLQDRAVLFVCTYRPVAAMETGPNAALFRDIRANLIRYGAIELEIRQGIDVAKYVAQRYPLNTFSPDFIANIQEQTEGHPLFVSQLFSLWQETGMITPASTSDGRPMWGLARNAEVHPAIPQTVGVVLEERIRLMEDELREILVCASVEGEDFTAQVITHLRRLDEYRTYDDLETLEHRYRLILELGPKDVDSTVLDFYRFVHRFFREYIYNRLSSGKRRILHRQVGECLEALYSNRQRIAGQLALHFREANELVKSARYALMAAQLEQSRYAWSESKKWCEFGLILVDKMPDEVEMRHVRIDLYVELSNICYYKSDYSPAIRLSEIIIREAGDNLIAKAQAYLNLSETHLIIGHFQAAHECAQQMLELAQSLGNDAVLARALDQFSWVSFYRADFQSAVEVAKEALILYEKLNDRYGMAFSCRVLGYTYEALGLYEESRLFREKGLTIATEMKDQINRGWLLFELGELYQTLEDWSRARACHEAHLNLVKDFKEEGYLSYAYDGLGRVEIAQGNFTVGLQYLNAALEIRKRVDEKPWVGVTLCNLSKANLLIGNLDVAVEQARSAVEIFESLDDRLYAPLGLFTLGLALSAAGKLEEAMAAFLQAKDQIGLTEFRLGKPSEALLSLEQSLKTWRELSDQRQAERLVGRITEISAQPNREER
jgi:predicted ATPase